MRRVTLTEDQLTLIRSLVRSEQEVYTRHHLLGGTAVMEDRREGSLASLADHLESSEVLPSQPEDRGPIHDVVEDLRVYLACSAGRLITPQLVAGHLSKFYELYAEKHGFRDQVEHRMAVLSVIFTTNLGAKP